MNKELDYYEGYRLCLSNAENHLSIAKLSESISLGISYAHLVLATEEAVKAMMLFNIHYDPQVLEEINDFDEYFQSHKHKHETIRNIEGVGLLMENMLMIQLSEFRGVQPGSISLEEVKSKMKKGTSKLIQWMHDLADEEKPEVSLKTNDDWWKQAESNKKEGFYVDILKKRKTWSGPHNFSQKRYSEGRKIAESFIEKVLLIEENFKDPDVVELYERMKKDS